MNRIAFWLLLVGFPALAGCQAFGGDDGGATIEADLTMYAAESDSIRARATAERTMAVATLVAAGTRVAELSAVNAALGATLRANYTGTPTVRAVVVSAEDMGASLEDAMMDEGATVESTAVAMNVSNLSTAASTDPDSGCSIGAVRQFSPSDERIYVTARVTALRAGSLFEVDWLLQGREVFSFAWQADYDKSFECVWFYATPLDFPFLPGDYAATLYVDGAAVGSTDFNIVVGG